MATGKCRTTTIQKVSRSRRLFPRFIYIHLLIDIEAAQHALDVAIGEYMIIVLTIIGFDTSLSRVVCGQNTYTIGFSASLISILQDPIYLGHYPLYMREMLQNRLPQFTDAEWKIVKGSSDFYGMNTYTTNLCR